MQNSKWGVYDDPDSWDEVVEISVEDIIAFAEWYSQKYQEGKGSTVGPYFSGPIGLGVRDGRLLAFRTEGKGGYHSVPMIVVM